MGGHCEQLGTCDMSSLLSSCEAMLLIGFANARNQEVMVAHLEWAAEPSKLGLIDEVNFDEVIDIKAIDNCGVRKQADDLNRKAVVKEACGGHFSC